MTTDPVAGEGRRESGTGEGDLRDRQGLWWCFARPQVVLGVHLGIVGGVSLLDLSRPGSGWRSIAAGLGAGWILWTPFEYAFHRWLLHHARVPLLRRIFWQWSHKDHHGLREMQEPRYLTVHLALTFPIAAVLAGGALLSTSGPIGPALVAGWLLGYCSYEGLHWLFHAGRRGRGLGRLAPILRLWDAHSAHHLWRADRNYGFVTQFWDRRFHTAFSPDALTNEGSGGAHGRGSVRLSARSGSSANRRRDR